MALFRQDREPQRRRTSLLASVAFVASLFTGNTFAQQQGSNDRPQREWDPVLSANIEAQREQEIRDWEAEQALGPAERTALETRRRAVRCLSAQEMIEDNRRAGVRIDLMIQGLKEDCPPEVTARVLRENQR